MSDLLRWIVAASANCRRLASEIDLRLRTNRFMRFIVAGGINTLAGFAVYSAVIIAGSEVWFALLVGMVSAVVINFLTHGGYVFRQLSLSRFPLFLTCHLFVYFVNLQLIQLLSKCVSNSILSQAILTIPLALLSYFLMAKVVFPVGRCVNPPYGY